MKRIIKHPLRRNGLGSKNPHPLTKSAMARAGKEASTEAAARAHADDDCFILTRAC